MAPAPMMTTDEYLHTPETLRPQELIDGVLRCADAPTRRHQSAVERLLIDAYRTMPAWEKARRVAEDCRALEALALAGLRVRHASAGPEEIRFHLAVLRLGWDLAVAVYGNPFSARD